MIYFSEIFGKKVCTEDGIKVGKLKDLVFKALDQPLVTKLVVQTSDKGTLLIPVSFLKKLNSDVHIEKNYEIQEIQENEMYVVKNLLDKQIIDIKGNKIVRVNDVVIQDKPALMIAGVDIGFVGILRWLKVEDQVNNLLSLFKKTLKSRTLSWADIQPLELARGKVVLRQEEDKLDKIPPEDLADHLEKTNIRNITRILDLLDEQREADVIENLNINFQTALFKELPVKDAAKIISLIDPDEAVDILLTLSHKKRDQILELLKPEISKDLRYLLNLSQTPIGEILTTEYLTVSPEQSVREVIDKIKKETGDFSFFHHVYVINKNNELIGVLNLHELMLQNLNTSVYKFMTNNVVVAHLTTPKEIVIKKMLKYKLFGVPVIDSRRHILGIVTFDDIAEDILQRI